MCNGLMTGWVAGMMMVNLLVGMSLVALLVVGVFAAIRWLWPSPDAGRAEDRALAILRERYARGEIARDEFETRRRDLSSS